MGVVLDRMQRELLPRLAARTTGGAGDPAGRAARDAEHQRHRRRPAGARHPDAVRRGHLPRGVRPPLPARGRVRRDQGGDRRPAGRDRRATCRSCATSCKDLMVVHPVRTPDGSPVVVGARSSAASSPGPERRRWSPAPAPTIRSTSRGSPACRTASPTARASWTSRISRTSTCGVDDLVNATKVIALAVLELTGTDVTGHWAAARSRCWRAA